MEKTSRQTAGTSDSEGEAPGHSSEAVPSTGTASTISTLDAEEARALLDSLGDTLALGSVFQIEDRLTRPPTTSLKRHPYVIIGGLPQQGDTPEIAVNRAVILAYRTSWKRKIHGTPPTTEREEQELLRTRSAVFSKRGSLKRCNEDGLFLINYKHTTLVRNLDSSHFLGWMPRPAVEWLLARAAGLRLPEPYPPVI